MHPVFFGAVEHVNTLRYTVTLFFNQSNIGSAWDWLLNNPAGQIIIAQYFVFCVQ